MKQNTLLFQFLSKSKLDILSILPIDSYHNRSNVSCDGKCFIAELQIKPKEKSNQTKNLERLYNCLVYFFLPFLQR